MCDSTKLIAVPAIGHGNGLDIAGLNIHASTEVAGVILMSVVPGTTMAAELYKQKN
jgi:hypothetical protein